MGINRDQKHLQIGGTNRGWKPRNRETNGSKNPINGGINNSQKYPQIGELTGIGKSHK